MTCQPIVIVGAGLGGLALARVLHVHGLPAVVVDLEASSSARPQGGMLDIHEDGGQRALQAAGLLTELSDLVLPGGDATRVLDRHGVVGRSDDGSRSTRPEVERGALRDLLLNALPEGTVRWGTKVTAISGDAEGRHELTLADGSSLTSDLLVGADGAWSRVRPLVSPVRPSYTGITAVETELLDADNRHPAVAAVVGTGSIFALGEGKGFLGHREFHGRLHVYANLAVPEDWAAGVNFTDSAAAKQTVLAQFQGWAPQLQALIADADGPLVPRPVYALPTGHRWPRIPGVTLVGDAAHVMSPFAGEGANLALVDGATLGQAIVDHPGDVEAALSAYEEEMFSRAAPAAAASVANLEVLFGDPQAPRQLLELFASFEQQAQTLDPGAAT